MSDITTDFIRATNKIYAKVATMLTHLQIIEGDVKLLRENSIKDSTEPPTDDQANDSKEKNQDAILSSDASQSEGNQNKGTEETKNPFYRFLKRWWDELHKPKFQVAVLTLMGLVAYTCETHRTNDLTQQGLTQSQRPWTGPERSPFLTLDQTNKGIEAQSALTVKNFGASPSLHGGYDMRLFGYTDIANDIDERIKQSCGVAELQATVKVNNRSFGFAVFPNGVHTVVDHEHYIVPPTQEIAVLGCVAYVDQLHDTPVKSPVHHTRFCFYSTSPAQTIMDNRKTGSPWIDTQFFECLTGSGAD
jgi:hypothetical protein